MKKILILLAFVLTLGISATARDAYSHDASTLPQAAQATVKANFKANISFIKAEKEIGRISEYEVVLTDGTEISFDRHGNWKNIETARDKTVPKVFIPSAITDYVAKNHHGVKITGIEKERSGFEVELANGIDMKFDKNGNFVRYDD